MSAGEFHRETPELFSGSLNPPSRIGFCTDLERSSRERAGHRGAALQRDQLVQVPRELPEDLRRPYFR